MANPKKFLASIDLTQNQLLNAVIQNLATAPGTPVAGQIYFDTTLSALRIYNATTAAWENKATDALLLQGQAGAFYLARGNATGQQLTSTISNLQATVIGYTLDSFAPPAGPLNLNNQKITNLATPVIGTDAANKAYVDAIAQGLVQKPTAQVATAAALPANVYANGTAGLGATLSATTNGVLTVDGYAVALGDLILVKNEAAAANNGLYTVTTLGTAGVPYVLTRHVDMDQANEFGGAFLAVENRGTATANSLWLSNLANTITVGTTAVSFTQLNAATALTAGNGIAIAGNTVTAVAAPGGGLTVGTGGIGLDATVAVRKYAVAFGDGTATSFTITHNLGTQDVTVGVYGATTPFAEVECDVTHPTINTVVLSVAAAPTALQYRAVVHG